MSFFTSQFGRFCEIFHPEALAVLVWKAKVEQPPVLEGSDGVGSNWKYSGRRRISPSRARRRRKAFLEKQATVVSQKVLVVERRGRKRRFDVMVL